MALHFGIFCHRLRQIPDRSDLNLELRGEQMPRCLPLIERRKILVSAIAAIALLGVVGIYVSIAKLDRSQDQLRDELTDVGAGSKVATKEFQNLRLSDKTAEARIRAAIDRANAALDEVDRLSKTEGPNDQLAAGMQQAQSAVLAITGETRTLEEQQFASELAKPLTARLIAAIQIVSEEMQERAREQARVGAARTRREVEERNKKTDE